MNEQEFAELAAGHALHALSDADKQRYADARVAHPEWESTASLDAQTAALLAESAAPVTPSPSIRDALLAQIATLPQSSDSDIVASPDSDIAASDRDTASDAAAHPRRESEQRTPRRRGRLIFALAASVALIVGIGFGVAALTSQLTQPASVVALEQIESSTDARQASVELESGGTATAHWSPSVGEAVLVTEGLEGLDDDSTYQLWFVRGEEPVSAGLFETDAGSATALLDGPMEAGDAIAVTVEPAGGSPTGQPTSDPIIVIPTA